MIARMVRPLHPLRMVAVAGLSLFASGLLGRSMNTIASTQFPESPDEKQAGQASQCC